MKIKLLFLVLLISAFACKKDTKDTAIEPTPEEIKSQVKAAANTIFKGCETVNADTVLGVSYNSADFVYVFNGRTLTYQDFAGSLAAVYDSLSSQEVTLLSEKYAILDNVTVLYTTNCTFLQHFKDGHDVLIDPVVMMFVFKKTDGRWRWIYAVESYG